MVSREQVILVSHDAVQAQLRQSRPAASPWRDRVLGPDDGAGYNFSNRTLRPFVRNIYDRLQADPVLAGQRFGLPARLPATELLDGKVSDLEIHVAGDICEQLSL